MKNKKIEKIKLMMSYQIGKTLEENIKSNPILENQSEIDEAGGEFGLANDLRAATNQGEKIAHLAQFFKMSEQEIRMAATEQEANLRKAIETSAAADAKGGFRAAGTTTLGKATKKASKALAVHEIMASTKELSEQDIINIIEKVKKDSQDISGVKDVAAVAKDTKKATNDANKLKSTEAENARLREEAKKNANQSIESAAGTSAAAAANPALTPEVKAVAQEASTVVKDMKPSRYERWKEWAKKNPKTNKALIFLGLTATGWVLYKMFSSNDRRDEVKKTLFANCAGDLLDTENSQILSMEDGSPVIYVSPTGNKEYDSKKGLKFLSNNRVFSGDNTMRGTWGCKGGTIGVQSEQTTGLPGTDLGLSALTKMAQNKEINKADSVGNVLNKINITWDTNSSGGDGGNTGGGGTQSTIPTELKDTDGVKKFQTWLDSKHGGWHTKYGTLNDNALKGWGKYGPNTTKAWSQYKDEYLNGSTASGTETPNPSAEVDVTKPSGIPGSPDMVGKSGLNLDVNRFKVTNQDLNNEIDKEVQPSNTDLTDRQKEILSNVKDRGVTKVYKGGALTPEEQEWLSKYYGGVVRKIKNEKSYGQKEVIDVPKNANAPKEPLSEENIIKKIVTKHLRSKL